MVRTRRTKASNVGDKRKDRQGTSDDASNNSSESQEIKRLKTCSGDSIQGQIKVINNNYKKDVSFEDDLFSKIFAAIHVSSRGTPEKKICAHRPQAINMVQSYQQHSMGYVGLNKLKKIVASPVISMVRDLQLYRTASPFDRRCTAMEWHHTNPHLIVTGSKGGDILLWNINDVNKDLFIQGRGPGGSISSLKFHPTVETKIYTSALDGKVSLQDFTGKKSDIFLDTMCWERWFCSLDTNLRTSQLAVGDTKGEVTLLTLDGKKIFNSRLHKQKVSHAEFSPREDWLLVTASLDKTVKVWDVRMLKDIKSCVKSLPHEKPLNSAYFSRTDGCRLLVTDQHQEVIVYNSTTWSMERTIQHPHRFFQHITPIKAQWHPLQDLIVVGRYPDPKFPSYTENEKRTIDIYSADSGEIVAQLSNPGAPGIVSLNKFNPQGDILASTMGVNILLWKRREELEEKQRILLSNMKQNQRSQGQSSNQHQQPRPKKIKKEKNLKLLSDTKTKMKKKNVQ